MDIDDVISDVDSDIDSDLNDIEEEEKSKNWADQVEEEVTNEAKGSQDLALQVEKEKDLLRVMEG